MKKYGFYWLILVASVGAIACNTDQKMRPVVENSPTNEQPAHTTDTEIAPNTPTTEVEMPSDKEFSEKDLEYKGLPVTLTKHARCRMGCRKIDAYEIQQILDKGIINKRKSGQNDRPDQCPTTALEGITRDKTNIRVIVAKCETNAKIVTVIDLDNDFTCTCN
jgi:hypothetical protein